MEIRKIVKVDSHFLNSTCDIGDHPSRAPGGAGSQGVRVTRARPATPGTVSLAPRHKSPELSHLSGVSAVTEEYFPPPTISSHMGPGPSERPPLKPATRSGLWRGRVISNHANSTCNYRFPQIGFRRKPTVEELYLTFNWDSWES